MSFDVLKTRFAAGMTSYVERDVKLCTITKTSSVAAGFGRHDMPRPPTTLTFDRLTLKLVCESHLRWGTFLLNMGTLGFCVLKLLAMYATNGKTDGRTKAMLMAPSQWSQA